jgi:hypothetical protein
MKYNKGLKENIFYLSSDEHFDYLDISLIIPIPIRSFSHKKAILKYLNEVLDYNLVELTDIIIKEKCWDYCIYSIGFYRKNYLMKQHTFIKIE